MKLKRLNRPNHSLRSRMQSKQPINSDLSALEKRLDKLEKKIAECCQKVTGDSPKPSKESEKPVAKKPAATDWKVKLKGAAESNGLHAVSASTKTTVAKAREMCAFIGVESPKSGETWINYTWITKLIGKEEHVNRLVTYWLDDKPKDAGSLARRIAKDCSGGMARAIATHLKVVNGQRSEKKLSEEIAKHLLEIKRSK